MVIRCAFGVLQNSLPRQLNKSEKKIAAGLITFDVIW